MTKLRTLAIASLLALTLAAHSYADDRVMVRVQPTQIDSVAKKHGLKVEKALRGPGGLYLVSSSRADRAALIRELQSDPLVQNAESNANVVLPEFVSNFDRSNRKIPVLNGGSPSLQISGSPWVAYVNQPANGIVRIADAQKKYGQGSGGVTVAVIDTGMDYSHPVLSPAIDRSRAHNFITDTGDASVQQETTPFVDQETTPFVDGAGTIVLNQETTPFVDQETTPFVDGSGKVAPAYGHATSVASIIRLVAPNVEIMPLRAFTSAGSGSMSDVIEAIYWAVQHGADVISMSFSSTESSAELEAAIQYAIQNNVICVASVSNSGSSDLVYPAALQGVIGVASTDNDDRKSSFSDWGADVNLAAPGRQIIAAYPQNHYAVVTGTSFATPYVAGAVALLRSIQSHDSPANATGQLDDGAANVKSPGLGAGRLDVFKSAVMATSKDR